MRRLFVSSNKDEDKKDNDKLFLDYGDTDNTDTATDDVLLHMVAKEIPCLVAVAEP